MDDLAERLQALTLEAIDLARECEDAVPVVDDERVRCAWLARRAIGNLHNVRLAMEDQTRVPEEWTAEP